MTTCEKINVMKKKIEECRIKQMLKEKIWVK
jgi:hypothetical protein